MQLAGGVIELGVRREPAGQRAGKVTRAHRVELTRQLIRQRPRLNGRQITPGVATGRVVASVDTAIGRLTPHMPKDLVLLLRTSADPARAAPPVLDELDIAVGSLHDELDHWRILTISAAAVFLDRLPGCREPLLRVVREARAGGAFASTVSALTSLSLDDWMAGRWDEAWQAATEGLELAQATGGHWMLAWMFEHRLAMLAAARGDPAVVRARADRKHTCMPPRSARRACSPHTARSHCG